MTQRVAGSTVRVLYAGESPPGAPSPAEVAADGAFDVSREGDFVDALRTATEGDVDCVVACHAADGFDGVAFLEALREDRPGLPVVLVTDAGGGEVARRAVAADVTAFVPAGEDARERIVTAIADNAGGGADRPDRRSIPGLTQAAERRLKERALDASPVGISISDAGDPQHPIVYVNESFEEVTGYAADEIMGVNHRFLQGPETDPDRVAELGEGIAEGRDTRVVLRNYTRDGTPFWNRVDVTPVRDADGEVTHFVGFQTDVTERERAKRELRAERETLDRLLDRVNGFVNDVTEALVSADSREEIERQVTERVGRGSEYDAAWVGRYEEAGDRVRVTGRAGTDAGGETLNLDGEAPGVRALREAVENQAVRAVEDAAGLPGSEAGVCVLVPLTYRSTTYGVLAVCDESLLDDRERLVLQSLGRSIGTSINDVLTKRTMTTDTLIEVNVELHDEDLFLVNLAAELDSQFEHQATMATDDGEGLLTLVETPLPDAGQVVEAARAYDGVLEAEALVADDDGSVVQLRTRGSPLVDVLSEFGSELVAMRTDGAALDIEFRVGTERTARRALDDLRERYDRVELLAYHDVTEPAQTARGFREELHSRLTERQLTALRKAYAGGYFEWPRRAEGTQLAESMGIVPSTFHQHLQAAERKLVSAFLDE